MDRCFIKDIHAKILNIYSKSMHVLKSILVFYIVYIDRTWNAIRFIILHTPAVGNDLILMSFQCLHM